MTSHASDLAAALSDRGKSGGGLQTGDRIRCGLGHIQGPSDMTCLHFTQQLVN